MSDLREQFGQIDVYLFDQLLRRRIIPGMRILDAGCGGGRNLVYFLREGYDIFGVDQDARSVEEARRVAAVLAPNLPPANFQAEALEGMRHRDAFFDFVICSAVLHFAKDDRQFRAMLQGMWRVLKVNGVLFCRLASSIGMETQVERLTGRHYRLPDGSTRYLVDEEFLETLRRELDADLLDPIKTTVVQNQRCMTTWVLRKGFL